MTYEERITSAAEEATAEVEWIDGRLNRDNSGPLLIAVELVLLRQALEDLTEAVVDFKQRLTT